MFAWEDKNRKNHNPNEILTAWGSLRNLQCPVDGLGPVAWKQTLTSTAVHGPACCPSLAMAQGSYRLCHWLTFHCFQWAGAWVGCIANRLCMCVWDQTPPFWWNLIWFLSNVDCWISGQQWAVPNFSKATFLHLVCFYFGKGHTWRCSGVIPSSVCRDNAWQVPGTKRNARDWSGWAKYKAHILHAVLWLCWQSSEFFRIRKSQGSKQTFGGQLLNVHYLLSAFGAIPVAI